MTNHRLHIVGVVGLLVSVGIVTVASMNNVRMGFWTMFFVVALFIMSAVAVSGVADE